MRQLDAGGVVWITGLSAAGKTTIASALVAEIRARGAFALLLDGDEVRGAIQASDAAHDREGRLRNAYRIARLARLMAQQRIIAVVATMSLFHEVHAWNRQNLPAYTEIFLDVDLDVLKKRDPKSIYQRLLDGTESNVAGFDLPFERPKFPSMIIKNNGDSEDIPAIVRKIMCHIGFSRSQ